MTKRTISVCYDGVNFTFKWLKSLLWARDEFQRRGVAIDFINLQHYLPFRSGRDAVPRSLLKRHTDALFLAHHHSHSQGIGSASSEDLFGTLVEFREVAETLVWCDTADSTGTCRFEVMPYVDLYFKKQLLKERERYYRPLWGGRIFCDYYHFRYGIDDDEVGHLEYEVLDPEHKDKLRLAWNLGVSDLFATRKALSYVNARGHTIPRFVSAKLPRTRDIHFRGSAWSSTAGWQRAKTREILSRRRDVQRPDPDRRVSRRVYLDEISKSRAVVSPFGWGEICFRDFESFALGAALIKPTMRHIETFPNWYLENETYVPISWDFSDFELILDDLMTDPQKYVELAGNAQELYRSFFIGRAAKARFADHILRNLGWE